MIFHFPRSFGLSNKFSEDYPLELTGKVCLSKATYRTINHVASRVHYITCHVNRRCYSEYILCDAMPQVAPEEFADSIRRANAVLARGVPVAFRCLMLGCVCCCCTAGASLAPALCLSTRVRHTIRHAQCSQCACALRHTSTPTRTLKQTLFIRWETAVSVRRLKRRFSPRVMSSDSVSLQYTV